MFNKQINRTIFLVSMAVLLFAGAAFNFHLNSSEKRNYSNLTLDRIMAHPNNDEQGSLTRGYSQGTATLDGANFQCCLVSTDMNGCDFTLEDSRCTQINRHCGCANNNQQ
jgi:hypothetical protein